jgi:hypothetical protein
MYLPRELRGFEIEAFFTFTLAERQNDRGAAAGGAEMMTRIVWAIVGRWCGQWMRYSGT